MYECTMEARTSSYTYAHFDDIFYSNCVVIKVRFWTSCWLELSFPYSCTYSRLLDSYILPISATFETQEYALYDYQVFSATAHFPPCIAMPCALLYPVCFCHFSCKVNLGGTKPFLQVRGDLDSAGSTSLCMYVCMYVCVYECLR